jgi:hypothetical protein
MVGRKVRNHSSLTGILNQNRNTRQDVLQSNEIIRHGPRGQKSKCRIPPALNVKKKQEFA